MLSLKTSLLCWRPTPLPAPSSSSSDIIHPIKMHYEILHRVLPSVLRHDMWWWCCDDDDDNDGDGVRFAPCPCPLQKKKTPPFLQIMSLTHSQCTTHKKKLPPHSSFYIFAHVESGWFVIYLSKLSAASSLVMRTPWPFCPTPHDQS